MHRYIKEHFGQFELICGCMFSGKSEELIRRLQRASYAKLKVVSFKHSLDERYDETMICSHNNTKIEAYPVKNVNEIKSYLNKLDKVDMVGIDEIQFFDKEIIELIRGLNKKNIGVIAAGLDLDFKGEPFGIMPELLARADKVKKLDAICVECGAPATKTQRLIDGIPAKFDDPIIMVGASEHYEARCNNCHKIAIDKNEEKKLIFMVGTGTEIGKTYVTTNFLKEKKGLEKSTICLKPVETGKIVFGENLEGSDAYNYSKLFNKVVDEINLYFFNKPMSPHIAAKIDGKNVEINKIKKFIDDNLNKYDEVYVEGAGGLMVPFTDNYNYLDLLIDYKDRAKVILITPNILGTINHSLTHIEILKKYGIEIEGIIFNDLDEEVDPIIKENNIETVCQLGEVKLLKRVGFNV